MNRRSFLRGLLSTTAVVAVAPPVQAYASGGIVKGIDYGAGDLTALTLRYQNQIASVTQIPARLLFGEWETPTEYLAHVNNHMRQWYEEYTIRSFPEQVQESGGKQDEFSQRARQDAWAYFAECAQRRRRWQKEQDESYTATVQISNGENR